MTVFEYLLSEMNNAKNLKIIEKVVFMVLTKSRLSVIPLTKLSTFSLSSRLFK